VVSVALLETSGEFDPLGVQTRARLAGDRYRISGTKLFVPYAGTAEALVCVARTDGAPLALSLLMVPSGTPGLELTRLRTSNGDPLFGVTFRDVEIPRSGLLGEPDRGWEHVSRMLERAAALKCAELVGIGQRALDMTVAYVSQRVQFGQPIGKFQAVQHHCADMYKVLEQARVLTAQAISRLDKRIPASREVSLAKVKASEGIPWLLRMAHQLHGGVGYYTEYFLETLYRRSIAAQAAYGSASWHRGRLADWLEKDPDALRRPGAHPRVGLFKSSGPPPP
jgi:alkylation response protein AidB-like acyl-CoA dehydrogenase